MIFSQEGGYMRDKIGREYDIPKNLKYKSDVNICPRCMSEMDYIILKGSMSIWTTVRYGWRCSGECNIFILDGFIDKELDAEYVKKRKKLRDSMLKSVKFYVERRKKKK